jgi:hypothetical protein
MLISKQKTMMVVILTAELCQIFIIILSAVGHLGFATLPQGCLPP